MTIGVGSSVGEDDTTKRVTLQVGAVGIELSSGVGGRKTQTNVADESDSLNVTGGFHPLSAQENKETSESDDGCQSEYTGGQTNLKTCDGTRRDETGTVVRLGAVGNDTSLLVSDGTVSNIGTPKTEVIL